MHHKASPVTLTYWDKEAKATATETVHIAPLTCDQVDSLLGGGNLTPLEDRERAWQSIELSISNAIGEPFETDRLRRLLDLEEYFKLWSEVLKKSTLMVRTPA